MAGGEAEPWDSVLASLWLPSFFVSVFYFFWIACVFLLWLINLDWSIPFGSTPLSNFGSCREQNIFSR